MRVDIGAYSIIAEITKRKHLSRSINEIMIKDKKIKMRNDSQIKNQLRYRSDSNITIVIIASNLKEIRY